MPGPGAAEPTADLATGPTRSASEGQRYLPVSPDDVVDLCVHDLDPEDQERFRRLAELLRALLHAAYRERWQQAKQAYAPFSPDTEARPGRRADAVRPEDTAAQQRLVRELRSVLDAANYDEVGREVLERALGVSSVFKVRLHAELDDFADLLVFRRGVDRRTATVSRWKGLRHQDVEYLEYRRVVLYARYRDESWFRDRDRDPGELPFTPGQAVLKLFQEVPEADLEMLLPNTEVRMRTVDKVVIGVPALASGVVVVTTKLATALGLLALLVASAVGLRATSPDIDTGTLVTLLGGFAALGGYLWRQYGKFTSRRTSFMQTLSESLYFKSIGDGPGVLFSVLDSAEEEDAKEALLAYRSLLGGPVGARELDEQVERRLTAAGVDGVDFEVADALGKLQRLGLAQPDGERCIGVPLPEAVQVLRDRWRTLGDRLAGPA